MKPAKAEPKAKAKSPSPEMSSETLSSNDTDSDSESDAESSSEDSSDEEAETKKPTKKTAKASKDSSSDSSDSSDSESDSDSDSDSVTSAKSSANEASSKKAKAALKPAKGGASKEEVSVTKKRRTDEEGASVTTAVHINVENTTVKFNGAQNGTSKSSGDGKKPRKQNTPFQRIKAEQVTFQDERLKDNSFESRVRYSCRLKRRTRFADHDGVGRWTERLRCSRVS